MAFTQGVIGGLAAGQRFAEGQADLKPDGKGRYLNNSKQVSRKFKLLLMM